LSRQFWSESQWLATADGVAVGNTTAETIIFPNVTIPANYLQDGRCLRIRAFGRYSNVVTAVPTLIFRLRWGGVAGVLMAATEAIVTGAAAITSAPWDLEAYIQTRSNGATGTAFCMGQVAMSTNAPPTFGTVLNYGVVTHMANPGLDVPVIFTGDFTADTALSLTAQWSAASASNTLTGHMYTGESLN